MADPFLAEVRIFGFSFAPRGWATCDGQLMQISQNAALYALIGTYYGGDGRVTMGLPNLQGRIPMHPGNGPGLYPHSLGEMGGYSSVTLSEAQIPAHTHQVTTGFDASDTNTPASNTFMGSSTGTNAYNITSSSPTTPMASSSLSNSGGSQPHQNMQPYMPLLFCICLDGIFPSRN